MLVGSVGTEISCIKSLLFSLADVISINKILNFKLNN